jgi:glycosyltransferase involved in cell wall biosynthesis
MNREELYLEMKAVESKGLFSLARLYRVILDNLSTADNYSKSKSKNKNSNSNSNSKKKIVFVYNQSDWCFDRLYQSIKKYLSKFEIDKVQLGDNKHKLLDADLYIHRGISWLFVFNYPQETLKRVISLIESERIFENRRLIELNKIAGVIPLNNKIRSKLIENGITNTYKVLCNGIDTEEFMPTVTKNSDIENKFIVGASGNFLLKSYDEWKGFSQYIVKAIQLCNKLSNSGVELRWCGLKGRSYNGLVSTQIKLEDMPSFYNELDCFVSMSKSEGCSGVIMEALASGIPVISTKVGWHYENCEEYKDGIIWTNRNGNSNIEQLQNINELIDKILYLRNNKQKRIQLSKNARNFAQRYGWHNTKDDWEGMIDFYTSN